ncbi:unnamed protein product, partial [marine sediment metagenome]
ATGYQFTNTTYSDVVKDGAYACLIESQGTDIAVANAYLRNSQPFSPEPYLSDGAQLSFNWNTLANPDMHLGSRVYISVQTTNSTGFVQWIYYYLSHTTLGYSNSTNQGYFFMNDTLNQWNDFDRNITEDYQKISELGNLDSSRWIQFVWIYAWSLNGASDKMQAVFDNFMLDDGSYSGYFVNGDFESTLGWVSYSSAPSHVGQSMDSTHETYSVEMSIPIMEYSHPATAHCSLSDTLASYPQGYYALLPGSSIIEFDWFFDDTGS